MTETAVDELLRNVDCAELAAMANRKTGGCLRAEDIPNLVGVLARTAAKTISGEASVAGIKISISKAGATLVFVP